MSEPPPSLAPVSQPGPGVRAALPSGTALALLAGEAASLDFAIQELVRPSWLLPFLTHNALGGPGRLRLIASLVITALLAAALASVYAWLARERAGARAVERSARLGAPLLVLWTLPALMNGAAYDGRPLDLLLAAAVVVVATELCARQAAQAWTELRAGELARSRARGFHPADLAAAALVVGYAVVSSVLSCRLHHKLLTSNYDLGLFENLLYNTLHGDHGIALTGRYFSVHAELILYPLLPFYALVPRTEMLLALQSVFLGAAAIPLYLLARRWLQRPNQALALVAIYLVYPAVHGPNFYDFHFLTFSVFFVMWAAYFFVRRRNWLFWPTIVLALACREDVALGLAAVGAGLVMIGRRRWTGLALAVVSSAWFVVVKFFWMRRFGPVSFANYYSDLIAPGEDGFGSVLRTVLSNPLYVFDRIVTHDKLLLALHLLVPLAFLPVRQRRTLFLLLPGFLILGLSTGNSAILQISFQYVCHFTPYLFVAAAAALAVRTTTARRAALCAGLVGSAIVTFQFGLFRYDHIEAGYQTMSFAWTRADASRAADLAAALALIPADASVSAGEHEGPHVARRRMLFALKEGTGDAQFLLFSPRSLRWGGRERVFEALERGSYGVRLHRGPIVLLERGAPTGQNAAVGAWLRSADPNI